MKDNLVIVVMTLVLSYVSYWFVTNVVYGWTLIFIDLFNA